MSQHLDSMPTMAEIDALNGNKFDLPTVLTISNGASGSLSLNNNKHYLLITNGYANTGRDISLIAIGGSGTVRMTSFASSATGISYDIDTANTLTISNTSGQGLKVYLFLLG